MKNPLKTFMHFYTHDIKLKKKFILSHAILVLAPTFVLSVLLYYQLSNVIVSNIVDSKLALATQTAQSIESTLSMVNHTSDQILLDPVFDDLQSLLVGKGIGVNRNYSISTESDEFVTLKEDADKFASTIFTYIDGTIVTDIKVYLDDSYSTLLEEEEIAKGGVFRPMKEIAGSYWYGIFSSTAKVELLCPSLYLTPSETMKYGGLAHIYKLDFLNHPQSSCYIAVYFSKNTFDSILRKDITTIDDSATYLVNERDALVSASSTNLAGKYILDVKDISKMMLESSKFKTMTFSNENAYVNARKIDTTDWYLVSVVPVNSTLSDSKSIITTFLLIYILFLGIAFCLAILLSNSIVKRISTVIRQMRMVRNGKPCKLIMPQEKDEIGDLVDTYNYMTDELNELMKKQEEAAVDLRKSEFKALQAQVNPHFLYNTLDMINWLSKSGQSDQVTKALQALSKFYKLTLNKGNITVNIKDELEHVSLYVELQNMRFNDSIQFIVDVPEELYEYEIPKLILQPLVENAILHGIFGRENKEGTIVITAWFDQENITFLLSDDGVGIPEKQLENIKNDIPTSTTGSNIGLANTKRRLKLFYNEKASFDCRSTEHEGTEIEIQIPAVKCHS